MADTKEESQTSIINEPYGHVVDGIIFPPGVVSSFGPRRVGEREALSRPEKNRIQAISNPFYRV